MITTGSVPNITKLSSVPAPKSDFLTIDSKLANIKRINYVIRVATPSMALLEGNGKLWSIRPGYLLPGMGRVLGIKRRGKRWIVETTYGEISNSDR